MLGVSYDMWRSFVAAYIGPHSSTMNNDTHTQRVILVDDCDNDNFFHDMALRKCGFERARAVDKAMCESIGCIKSYQVKPLTRETAAALIDMP